MAYGKGRVLIDEQGNRYVIDPSGNRVAPPAEYNVTSRELNRRLDYENHVSDPESGDEPDTPPEERRERQEHIRQQREIEEQLTQERARQARARRGRMNEDRPTGSEPENKRRKVIADGEASPASSRRSRISPTGTPDTPTVRGRGRSRGNLAPMSNPRGGRGRGRGRGGLFGVVPSNIGSNPFNAFLPGPTPAFGTPSGAPFNLAGIPPNPFQSVVTAGATAGQMGQAQAPLDPFNGPGSFTVAGNIDPAFRNIMNTFPRKPSTAATGPAPFPASRGNANTFPRKPSAATSGPPPYPATSSFGGSSLPSNYTFGATRQSPDEEDENDNMTGQIYGSPFGFGGNPDAGPSNYGTSDYPRPQGYAPPSGGEGFNLPNPNRSMPSFNPAPTGFSSFNPPTFAATGSNATAPARTPRIPTAATRGAGGVDNDNRRNAILAAGCPCKRCWTGWSKEPNRKCEMLTLNCQACRYPQHLICIWSDSVHIPAIQNIVGLHNIFLNWLGANQTFNFNATIAPLLNNRGTLKKGNVWTASVPQEYLDMYNAIEALRKVDTRQR